MNPTVWIFLGVAALVVLGYFVTMRVFFRQSRELDRHVDLTKMRKWEDDDDN